MKILNCGYTTSEKRLLYPRVLWIAECGYQYTVIQGYEPDTEEVVKPVGTCGGCNKDIKVTTFK